MTQKIIYLLVLLSLSSEMQGKFFDDNNKTSPEGGAAEFRCVSTGWFPHPNDSSLYYVCYLNTNNEYVYYKYQCPKGTCFKAETRHCTAAACNSTCLKENVAETAEFECMDETLTLLKRSLDHFIDSAATRGRPFNNYRLSLRDVHLQMRTNYAQLIQAVGQNIFPLIVAAEADTPDLSGVGGAYKLYHRNGTMQRIVPVPSDFEMHKCLSHIVLGIFATISPYFRSPNSISWKPAVRVLQQKIKDALYTLPLVSDEDVSVEDKAHARLMMTMSDDYLENCLQKNSVDHELYQQFANSLAPLIDKSMAAAAKSHASHTIPALLKWKHELGDDWEKVYVIIPTIWPVSKINLRYQMFQTVMSYEQVSNQVLIVEGARTEDEARTTLGRIVADRALAQLVFGNMDQQGMREHTFSLSTRRDFLSSVADKAIKDYCENDKPVEEVRCPVAKMFGPFFKGNA